MRIIKLLDRPIAFHRCLVEVTGSVPGALLLSQAIYWQNRPTREDDSGWWYKTYEHWNAETGLSRRDFATARRGCSGILLHKLKGVPAKTWYKVDEEKLQASLYKVCKLERPEPPNQFAQGVQTICTETNPETKAENKGEGRFAPPSLEEVVQNGDKIGLPKSECELFHAHFESVGWVSGSTKIRSWPSAMIKWKLKWEKWGRESKPISKPSFQDQVAQRNMDAMTRTIERLGK